MGAEASSSMETDAELDSTRFAEFDELRSVTAELKSKFVGIENVAISCLLHKPKPRRHSPCAQVAPCTEASSSTRNEDASSSSPAFSAEAEMMPPER